MFIGCSGSFEFINNQPIYLGSNVGPGKTTSSPQIQKMGKTVYGTDEESAVNTTDQRVSTTRSIKATVVAVRAAEALGNDPTRFLANSEIEIMEIVSFGWIISQNSFYSQIYQVKK
jgi:hypothetical protein